MVRVLVAAVVFRGGSEHRGLPTASCDRVRHEGTDYEHSQGTKVASFGASHGRRCPRRSRDRRGASPPIRHDTSVLRGNRDRRLNSWHRLLAYTPLATRIIGRAAKHRRLGIFPR